MSVKIVLAHDAPRSLRMFAESVEYGSDLNSLSIYTPDTPKIDDLKDVDKYLSTIISVSDSLIVPCESLGLLDIFILRKYLNINYETRTVLSNLSKTFAALLNSKIVSLYNKIKNSNHTWTDEDYRILMVSHYIMGDKICYNHTDYFTQKFIGIIVPDDYFVYVFNNSGLNSEFLANFKKDNGVDLNIDTLSLNESNIKSYYFRDILPDFTERTYSVEYSITEYDSTQEANKYKFCFTRNTSKVNRLLLTGENLSDEPMKIEKLIKSGYFSDVQKEKLRYAARMRNEKNKEVSDVENKIKQIEIKYLEESIDVSKFTDEELDDYMLTVSDVKSMVMYDALKKIKSGNTDQKLNERVFSNSEDLSDVKFDLPTFRKIYEGRVHEKYYTWYGMYIPIEWFLTLVSEDVLNKINSYIQKDTGINTYNVKRDMTINLIVSLYYFDIKINGLPRQFRIIQSESIQELWLLFFGLKYPFRSHLRLDNICRLISFGANSFVLDEGGSIIQSTIRHPFYFADSSVDLIEYPGTKIKETNIYEFERDLSPKLVKNNIFDIIAEQTVSFVVDRVISLNNEIIDEKSTDPYNGNLNTSEEFIELYRLYNVKFNILRDSCNEGKKTNINLAINDSYKYDYGTKNCDSLGIKFKEITEKSSDEDTYEFLYKLYSFPGVLNSYFNKISTKGQKNEHGNLDFRLRIGKSISYDDMIRNIVMRKFEIDEYKTIKSKLVIYH